jgi:hypothetical protein
VYQKIVADERKIKNERKVRNEEQRGIGNRK